MKPEFLIIGAQKCGTSWLHEMLGRHPQIFMPPDKDVELFSYSENVTDENVAQWRQRFEDAGHRLAGDTTASYFWTLTGSEYSDQPAGFNPCIPASVVRYLDADTRYIITLRDPVRRTVSAWLHHLAFGSLPPDRPFRDCWREKGLVDMGFYARHLDTWLHFVGRRRVLVIDEVFGATPPQTALARVCRFLGVADDHPFTAPERPVFAGIERRWCDDGVWVAGDDPRLIPHLAAFHQAPVTRIDEREFLRLVDSDDIRALTEIFAADQTRLAAMI